MTAGNSNQSRFKRTTSGEASPAASASASATPPSASGATLAADGSPPTSSSIQTPAVATTGSAVPANFDSERTVISKEIPAAVPLPMAQLPPAEMGKVLQGQRLGHYELQEFVGGGGMGAVFRAHDTTLDRIVAVKVLSKVQSNDEETLRRFKNEAQSAARLDHENIGRVHYVGEDRGWHYIVFEFIDGINLRDLVDNDGPLSLADAVSYTLQVADALAHAAHRDVVHRDIKPSNVLITPGGRAKLVDMGLARLHQVEHSDNDLTASGVTLGTFDYISPEQARDPRNADVRSDIYSLGCTLYFVVTGRPPFPDGTVLQKLLQHQAEEPADPRILRPDLPEELLRILRRMLAKAPGQRYQQPEGLMRDLVALTVKLGLPVPSTTSALWAPVAESSPPLMVRHLPWVIPIGVLLLVALVVAIASRSSDADVNPPPIRRLAAAGSAATVPSEPGGGHDVAAGKVENAISSDRVGSADRAQPNKEPTGPDVAQTSSEKHEGASTTDGNDSSAKLSGTGTAAKPAGDNPASAREHATGGAAVTNEHADSSDAGERAGSVPKSFVPLVLLEGANSATANQFDLHDWTRRRLRNLLNVSLSGDMPSVVRVPWEPASLPATVASRSAEPASASPDRVSAPTPERKGLLVVSRSHEGPGDYASLAEACRAAKSGDVVELRYSGRLDNRPIALSGQRLTIRAGDGFSPAVNFQPRESDLAQSHSMIALGGGQLTLVNLQLELAVPREVVSESLSLGEIRPGESIRLDGCVLTIRNASDSGSAYHPDVALFDIRAVPGPGVMASKDGPLMRPAASLQLMNCVVRGEALFVRANESQPAQIAWTNGLLVTSERFLAAAGGPSDPKPQGQLLIELRHLTAIVQSGLVQLSATQDAPLQLPLEIDASDCIFVGKSGAPLIEQSGIDEPEDLRKHIAWNGDRNFYEGFSVYWRMGGPAGAETTVQMTLADWQGFWGPREIQPSADSVAWQQLPTADRAVHFHLPADYVLRGGENPAHNAGSDGRDAGFQSDQLPIIKD